MGRFAIIEAPSILRLRPTGVERLPDALLRAGLADGLHARHAGRVEPGLGGFWVHVDADVVDDELLPAVDYRLPGGLSWRELEQALAAAAATGRMAGLDLTVFNPVLDYQDRGARELSGTIVAALS